MPKALSAHIEWTFHSATENHPLGQRLLLQRLARAGFNVVGIEAGPFWDIERDWVSDEAGSHELYWECMGA